MTRVDPAHAPGSYTLLPEPVRAAFAAAGSLEATVVEVTEQSAIDDYEALAAVLELLRRRGALIAVDDAGAGAGLSHVTRLRPDFVKIDRGLVSDRSSPARTRPRWPAAR